jgi:hypothetical protein
MSTIGKTMYIDRPHQITVSLKATGFTCPISAFGLMKMSTARTLTRCSSFRASEARDVSLFAFVSQIVDVFAILPQAHPLIMISAMILMTYAMRIAHEERSDLLLDAKVDDLSGGFVTQITNTTFASLAELILRLLQFLPATGMLLAPALLFGKVSQLLIALVFEGTDPTTGHDQSVLGIGGDGREVDFSQVDRGWVLAWSSFRSRNLDADVQFKASVPDQRTGSTFWRKIQRQNQRGTTTSHRQNGAPWLFADGLFRPHDGIEPLGFVGIAHLGVAWFQLARGVDIGKEGMYNHLDGLTMQGKAAFRRFLQGVASRPWCMFKTSLFMHLHTAIPDVGRLLLSGFQSAQLVSRQVFKPVHAHGFHERIIS